MSKSQKDDKGQRNKRTGNSGGAGLILLALLIVLTAAAYLVFYSADGTKRPVEGPVNNTSGDADYNLRCNQLHAAVDRVLDNQNLAVSDVRQEKKEVVREQKDGKIRWNARHSLIESTGSQSAGSVRKALESGLKPSGGIVLKSEPDQYHGYAVTRFDIGFRDQLGGGPLTIISDRLYVVEAPRKQLAVGLRQKTNPAHKGEIALIIDDFGYRQDMIAEFASIRSSFTFAVIPFRQFSREAAIKAVASGHQVMVHLPMEPLSGIEDSEISATVRTGMNREQVREMVDKAVASLPGVVGLNNHQGSKATADRRLMESVMRVLRPKNLFFVDSRTNGRSVAAETARREKVKNTENDLFIDGMADTAYVKKQMRVAGEMAKRMGSVTVIGHARPTTAAALRQIIPELEAQGIRFVFVSQLVR